MHDLDMKFLEKLSKIQANGSIFIKKFELNANS